MFNILYPWHQHSGNDDPLHLDNIFENPVNLRSFDIVARALALMDSIHNLGFSEKFRSSVKSGDLRINIFVNDFEALESHNNVMEHWAWRLIIIRVLKAFFTIQKFQSFTKFPRAYDRNSNDMAVVIFNILNDPDLFSLYDLKRLEEVANSKSFDKYKDNEIDREYLNDLVSKLLNSLPNSIRTDLATLTYIQLEKAVNDTESTIKRFQDRGLQVRVNLNGVDPRVMLEFEESLKELVGQNVRIDRVDAISNELGIDRYITHFILFLPAGASVPIFSKIPAKMFQPTVSSLELRTMELVDVINIQDLFVFREDIEEILVSEPFVRYIASNKLSVTCEIHDEEEMHIIETIKNPLNNDVSNLYFLMTKIQSKRRYWQNVYTQIQKALTNDEIIFLHNLAIVFPNELSDSIRTICRDLYLRIIKILKLTQIKEWDNLITEERLRFENKEKHLILKANLPKNGANISMTIRADTVEIFDEFIESVLQILDSGRAYDVVYRIFDSEALVNHDRNKVGKEILITFLPPENNLEVIEQ